MLNELYIRKIEFSMIMVSIMLLIEYKNILNKLLLEIFMKCNILLLKMEVWFLVLFM